MPEDDQREWAAGPRRRRPRDHFVLRAAERRVVDDGFERPGCAWPSIVTERLVSTKWRVVTPAPKDRGGRWCTGARCVWPSASTRRGSSNRRQRPSRRSRSAPARSTRARRRRVGGGDAGRVPAPVVCGGAAAAWRSLLGHRGFWGRCRPSRSRVTAAQHAAAGRTTPRTAIRHNAARGDDRTSHRRRGLPGPERRDSRRAAQRIAQRPPPHRVPSPLAGRSQRRRQRADVREHGRDLPRGGTILGTSRTNPYRDGADGTPAIRAGLEEYGVDALIPIGGEDTLGVALRLHRDGFRSSASRRRSTTTSRTDVHVRLPDRCPDRL